MMGNWMTGTIHNGILFVLCQFYCFCYCYTTRINHCVSYDELFDTKMLFTLTSNRVGR